MEFSICGNMLVLRSFGFGTLLDFILGILNFHKDTKCYEKISHSTRVGKEPGRGNLGRPLSQLSRDPVK